MLVSVNKPPSVVSVWKALSGHSKSPALIFIYSCFILRGVIILDPRYYRSRGLKTKFKTNAGLASVQVRLSEETAFKRH